MPLVASKYIIYQPDDDIFSRVEFEPGERISDDISEEVLETWREMELIEDRKESEVVVSTRVKPPLVPPPISQKFRPGGSMAASSNPAPPRGKR
jgi:hypothetical protein